MNIQEAREMIIEILQTSEPERSRKIYDFQDFIWNGKSSDTEEDLNELLDELAVDLDDYEPNPEVRKECRSFYGEEKLVQNIQEALQAIEALEIKNKNEQKDKD